MSNSKDSKFSKSDDLKAQANPPSNDKNNKASSKIYSSKKRGTVLKKALNTVGISTKEDRFLQGAEAGDIDTVTQLLNSGVDVNYQNEHGESSLMYSAWRGHEAVVAAILQFPATHVNLQDIEGWSALLWGARGGHATVVRLFLVHPDTEPDLCNALGETALMKACVHNHVPVVRLLSTSYRTTINKTHPDGSHALIWAAAGGSLGSVNALLDAGGNISICDRDGIDALMWAVLVGHLEVVVFLTKKGSNASRKDNVGRTPLIMAAETGYSEIVTYLSSFETVDVNDRTKDNITALMRAAEYGHPNVIDVLTKCSNIEVNLQDYHGYTAIMYAARGGHSESVFLLLQHPQIQPDITDMEQISPLMISASYGHDGVVTALLSHNGSDIQKRSTHGYTALIMSAKNGQRSTVMKLLTHSDCNINERDDQGLTAITWATRHGAIHVVELLQQYRELEPDKADVNGLTALMWAARSGQLVAVKTLLRDTRVNPVAKDKSGKTAFIWAHNLGHSEIELLLKKYVQITTDSADEFRSRSSSSSTSDSSDTENRRHTKSNTEYPIEADIENVNDVETLLENGPYISWRQRTGKTSFAWAVEMGQTDVVRIFLLVPGININEIDDETYTPLIIASRHGHLDIVKLLLLRESIDPNIGDKNGKTPLMYASIFGQLRVVHALLSDMRTNVNQQDNDGYTALTLSIQSGLFEISSALLRHTYLNPNVKTSVGKTSLIYAIQSRHDEIAELLIDSSKTFVNFSDPSGDTPLLIAAGSQGNDRITKRLLKHKRILVNKRAEDAKTALIAASMNNHLDTTKLLLEHKEIDVNAQDKLGKTAMMYACAGGFEEIVRLLFSHPDINPNLKCSENSSTAVIFAARENHPSIVAILISRKNIDINQCDDFRATALTHAVKKKNQQSVESLLDRQDILVNIPDAEGKTPLVRALSDTSYGIAMLLLARTDIDVNAPTLEGKTALMYSAMYPEGIAPLRLMLASKAVLINAVDEHRSSAMIHGCKSGNFDAVTALLERPDIDLNTKDSQAMTALMWTAMLGFRNIVTILIQQGTNIELNACTTDGSTALGLACESGNVDVVQTLTSHPGVYVNGSDSNMDRTPIVMALEKSQHECTQILLQHPFHSLTKSGVRAPYLPPNLKDMVYLYKNFIQIRHALILNLPPPGLLVDGTSQAGESCIAAGGEFASTLLTLPRPFQVVQHNLRKSSMSGLTNILQIFAKKINTKQPGVVILFISGEISITDNGPCLRILSSEGSPGEPFTYPLNSLLKMLSEAPTLIFFLNIVSVHIDDSLNKDCHARAYPECYIMPPLVHCNMSAIGGVMQRKKKLIGTQCSPFVHGLCNEVLHGVSLPQLHKRINQFLIQDLKQESSYSTLSSLASPYFGSTTGPHSIADGATSTSGKAKAFYISNMSQEWLF